MYVRLTARRVLEYAPVVVMARDDLELGVGDSLAC